MCITILGLNKVALKPVILRCYPEATPTYPRLLLVYRALNNQTLEKLLCKIESITLLQVFQPFLRVFEGFILTIGFLLHLFKIAFCLGFVSQLIVDLAQ